MDVYNSADDLKNKLHEASNKYQYLLEHTHNEALVQNDVQTQRWQAYRTEHDELSNRLLSLRDKLAHSILVPLGQKGFMRGNLVHTNEILVCLGDGWFSKQSAKQAAGICQRRIQNCDEMLQKLQKEKELLTSRKTFTSEAEAFDGDETREIVEPYDEEAEKLWREKHRQKEKEYHQKLAKLKETKNTKIETEEQLWSRLDALDLQEELEDELDRMDEFNEHEDLESEESEDDDSDSNDSSIETRDKEKQGDVKNTLKRKVSFKEDGEDNQIKENKSNVQDEKENDLIRIVFKHSDVLPVVPSAKEDEINSPADIYSHYMRSKMPKSILKPSTIEDLPLPPSPEHHVDTRHLQEGKQQQSTKPTIQAIGDVVERAPTASSAPQSDRPVSRFKAARLSNKR